MSDAVSATRSASFRCRCAPVAAGVLGVLVLLLAFSSIASAESFTVHRLCGAPRPGDASCMGMKLVPASLSPADLHARSLAQASEAHPAVTEKTPIPGYLTPQALHAAYALPTGTPTSGTQTIAVVDAFDDPGAEADLGVYDTQFGLPACTTANGCFRKINEEGQSSPLPQKEGGWAAEISIDVQMAHATCQSCRVLLVEADSESFEDLGKAVNAAVKAGASEISNSYGGPEISEYASLNSSYYNHPGLVVTASSGDCGYLNHACLGYESAANFPADSPDVVAVGGTTLTEAKGKWKSTVWKDGGSGCSVVFSAPLWQSAAANFSATGCADGRSVADVAAIGDPETGVDVYDSTPDGNGDPTGWGVWGGTSVASPIIAAEFALAGGPQDAPYPAATLYTHLGQSGALYDVITGSDGSCGGATSCKAAAGYDGPTGVGSPEGLGAFVTAGSPTAISPPAISGLAEQGQTLTAAHGEWAGSPTSIADQWEDCNTSGSECSAIAGATGTTYKLTATDVGHTIRVQESATNSSGTGVPATSAQSAAVTTDVPAITGFSPTSAITGTTVTIRGAALAEASAVHFGTLAASFQVLSATEIAATVPDGEITGKVSVSTPAGTVTASGKFTATLSIKSFTPASGAPGKQVTVRGVGFTAGSLVSFDGVPASKVTFVSSKVLKALVPEGAGTGQVTVTNKAAPAGTVASAGTFKTT
jgi:hypothetical protein